MATLNPHAPKSKNKISDIASMFGGMAKMKKVRTPRKLKMTKLDKEQERLRKKMEALKHVDDSKKNLFANKLTSDQNLSNINLRTRKERQPSPMPPLFRLPNDIANAAASLSSHTNTSCSSSSGSESEGFLSSSTASPHSSTKRYKNRRTPKQDHINTKPAIDLNAMRAKLRPVAKKEANEHLDIEEDDEHNDILDNSTPKSSAVSPPSDLKTISLNKERNASWSSNKSNEDTEIDDISSTRSNSINKEEDIQKKNIVITINGENILTQNEEEEEDIETPTPSAQEEDDEEEEEDINRTEADYNWFNINASADDQSSLSSSSTMSSDTDITDDDEDVDGLRKHQRNVSLKHKIKKRKFGSEISLDTSDGTSRKDIFILDAQPLNEEEESLSSTESKTNNTKHKKRASSASVYKQWNYDDLFGDNVEIGAIKTPKFDKEEYNKKKQQKATLEAKPRKRASSALLHKTWNYDELFGDNVEIGAIKTPKFDKKEWKKKQKQKEKKEKEKKSTDRKRASSAYIKKEWNYDELFGDNVEIGAIKTPKFNKEEWKKKNEKKKDKRASSALMHKKWDYDELFGENTTNTEREKKRRVKNVGFKHRKRSKTENKKRISRTRKRAASAVAKKSWNYDDLFGENVEIGAIKTPKFTPAPINTEISSTKKTKKTKKKKKSDSDEKAFDLRDILGDDFSLDDLSRMKRECDEAEEYDYNTHYSSSEADDDEDDSFINNIMGDITPATPEIPDLPPLNAHNLSIDTMPRLSIAKQPNIEMIEEGDEEEEEEESIITQNVDKLMEIFTSSSDDDFYREPQPAKSKFELEREEYDEMEKEIENDMNFERENKEELLRQQKKRDSEIMHDLDDLFDDDDGDSAAEAMEKRNSLEDVLSNEMKSEDNEPLGDDTLSVNDDDTDTDYYDESEEEEDKSEEEENKSEEEEDESEEETEEHELDKLSLRELMAEFRMNASKNEEFAALFEYFTDVLGVNYAHELVNYLPSNITQPPLCKETKTRMLLTKMAKYVTNQVLHNYWSGSKATEWAQLETNKLTYTFKKQRSVKTKREEAIERNLKPVLFEREYADDKSEKSNSVQLDTMDERFLEKQIALNEEYSVTFSIDALPQINKKSKAHYLINIGVGFYSASKCLESVFISDRCSIHRNDNYLEQLSISNSKMIDTNSQIIIHCENLLQNPRVTFSHLKNYRLYKHNMKTIQLDGFLQRKSSKTYAKIFIQQSYGNGSYSVNETITYDIESEESDEKDSDDENKKNESSIARNLEKFRRVKSCKKTKHRASI